MIKFDNTLGKFFKWILKNCEEKVVQRSDDCLGLG